MDSKKRTEGEGGREREREYCFISCKALKKFSGLLAGLTTNAAHLQVINNPYL